MSGWTEQELAELDRRRAAMGFVEALRPLSVADTSSEAAYQATVGPIRKLRAHPERDLEKACSDLLQCDGWRLLKTDPVSDRRRGKGFGEIGMADCLYIRYLRRATGDSEVMWIEWKAPRGKPSGAQRLWIAAERARGALVWLAGADFPASVEGFLAHYQESGLMRRKP